MSLLNGVKVPFFNSEPLIKINPDGFAVLCILAFASALSAVSIDLFFPTISIVSKDLAVSVDLVQVSVYGFFIGLGVAQLFWGNLADYLGRRPIMLIGAILYCLAVLGCLLSSTIYLFIFFRFLQGVASAVGIILARAVIRDIYGPDRSGKAIATMFLMFSAMPVILPTLGGYISTQYHWRWILYLMLGFGMFMVAVIYLLLMETVPTKKTQPTMQPINRKIQFFHDYWKVAIDSTFLKYTLTNMFAFAALLIFVSNCSILLEKYYDFTAQHTGYFMTLFGMCLMFGVVVLRFLVPWLGMHITILLANSILFLSCLFMGILNLSGKLDLYMVLIPSVIGFGASISILLALCAGGALKPFTNNAGAASSLYGFMQHLGASLIGFLFSFLINGDIQKVSIYLLIISMLCFCSYYLVGRSSISAYST